MIRAWARPLKATIGREEGSRRPRAAAVAGVAAAVGLTLGAGPAVSASSRAAPAVSAVSAAQAAPAVTAVAWGDNSAGELGDNTLTGTQLPASVAGLSGPRTVAEAGRHALALLPNGTVVAWGDDTFGQLGNGIASSNGDSEAPALVSGLSKVTAVAAGEEHSLALLSNGTVVAWGDNAEGQLGNGSTASSAVPVAVKGLTGVKAIAAGGLFSLALLSNGTVMSWGDNREGALGNGTVVNSAVPVRVKALTGVKAIAGGGLYALALLSNGTAMSWGDNEADQLGDGQDVSVQPSSEVPVKVTGITGVRAIAAGSEHGLALLASGTVMVWGSNSEFQLARSNGFPGGVADSDVPLTVPGLPKATAIAAGGQFSLAIVAGGKVDGWGDNAFGQLGNGTNVTTTSVVTVRGLSGATAVTAGGESALALRPSAAASAASAASAAAGPVSSPWRVAANPVDPVSAGGLTDVAFAGVSALSANTAWAVGASSALFNPQPLAERWDGTAWHRLAVPLPATATAGRLAGVLQLGPANAWAVGSITPQTGGTNLTLIEHWNGTRWSVVPSPNPETGIGTTDTLEAIGGTSASNLWAVGSFGTDMFNAMLFEHWNGTKWSFAPPPIKVGDIFGNAVTVISATDAWAVGDTATATISAHWNGHAWSFVSTPFLTDGAAPTNSLTGVTSAGPNNVWASGYEGNVNQQNFALPYVLHWNGTAWSLAKVPNSGSEGSQLHGITALSATDMWASGETLESDGSLLTLTEHFNGKSWSIAPSLDPGENPPLINSTFAAVAGVAPHTLFAVGAQETPTQCCLMALAERSTTG